MIVTRNSVMSAKYHQVSSVSIMAHAVTQVVFFMSLNMLHLLNTIKQYVLYFHIFKTIIVFELSP